MNIVYLLLPLALLIAAVFVLGFLWSVRNDKEEDLESSSMRILFDDDERKRKIK